MTSERAHAELVCLRKVGEELASSRRERMTSIHLLAAIAAAEGPATELLRERKLSLENVLKASRAFDDDGPNPIPRLLTAAKEVAKRAPAKEPTALHLLLALLGDRSSAAHRSLVQMGVDLSRLRTQALQIALGVVAARRIGVRPNREVKGDESQGTQTRVPMKAQPTPSFSHLERNPNIVPVAPKVTAPARAVPAHVEQQPRKAAAPKSGRLSLDRAAFPTLASLGRNLTELAHLGKLEPVVGRDREIDQVLDILAKRHANSPCLIGPPGVGKTSIVMGLAQRLSKAHEKAEDAKLLIVELVVSEILAGTGARGALAEKLAAIRTELKNAEGRIILFVDDIHELFAGGALDEAAAEMKVALSRSEILLIGATTQEEYKKSIELDPVLARRFAIVEVEEPSEEDAFFLSRSVANSLSKHHGVKYNDEAVAASIGWSIRYLPGRALPDKAISILDLAGARTRRKSSQQAGARARASLSVGQKEVGEIISELSDVPLERLLETDRESMLRLEKDLADRVIGHRDALARIAHILRRNAAGFRSMRPIGTFLLLGPTGVGKTETAKALAETLFHSADAMTRLDFSEYSEAHAVARLVGAPPGYVGHESGGQLTEAVRRRPYQVLLLDEIEKAHRDVLEAFLQVFDEGRLTDGRGRRVDFTNTVIVMTSNLGAAELGALRSERSVGFSTIKAPLDTNRIRDVVVDAAKAHLPPELYNRIDEILCYAPLSRNDVAEIAKRIISELSIRLEAKGIQLQVDDGVTDALLDAGGFDPELGARPMKRTIARLIEAPLAELILSGQLGSGGVALLESDGATITVDSVPPKRRVSSGCTVKTPHKSTRPVSPSTSQV